LRIDFGGYLSRIDAMLDGKGSVSYMAWAYRISPCRGVVRAVADLVP
jgi:hypothetical protein